MFKPMHLFFLVSLILLASVSGTPQGVPAESFFAPQVSIVHLVANPEKYDGKRVQVFGYLHVRFEDSALYLSKDDADHLIGVNAVWVKYDPAAKLDRLDGKEIESRSVGDLRYFDGTLCYSGRHLQYERTWTHGLFLRRLGTCRARACIPAMV